jgi:hypothetical protein
MEFYEWYDKGLSVVNLHLSKLCYLFSIKSHINAFNNINSIMIAKCQIVIHKYVMKDLTLPIKNS